MQEFNSHGFRITSFYKPVRACCQFMYKGYEVSMSTIFDGMKVAVYQLIGNPSDPEAEFDTVQQAIEWIDNQVTE